MDYNTDLPLGTGCDDHGANRMSSNECAWTEGFAHFMSAAIYNNPVLKFSTYLHPINIENGKYNTLTDGTGGTSFPTNSLNLGTSNEGWVASALWDIYDNSSESGDDINEKKTKLWLTFTDVKESTENIYPASSILDFKNDWDDNDGYSSLDNVFSLNNLPITNVTPTTGSIIFSDDFEGNLSQWTNTGDEQIWEILTISGDKVASSDDCSTYCYLESDTINASQSTTLTFDRYIDRGVDGNEGLKVSVSTNNGASYTELVFYSQNYGQDDSTWHTETLDISSYQSSTFKVKFTGVSSYSNDIVRIDDVTITGSSTDTSQSFSQSQTVNKRLIDNSDRQETIGTISVNQDITIDTITLEITITHEDHDEVRAYLVSPDGEKIKVLNRPRGIDDDLRYTHIITLPTGTSMNGFVGDNVRGDWTLTMGDYYRGDVGTVHSWKLSITGT